MEDFIAFLIKLAVIFIGSGFTTLLAYLVAREISHIPRMIYEYERSENRKAKLKIKKQGNINSKSAFYEVYLDKQKPLKIFSSQTGMKVVHQ